MKLRRGFTLIELLIVVTIIAILAGAAIPYVQDYVDESRRARCKNDLDEIRNALALYELRRGVDYSTDNIASLIGPFLSKPINDPWGAPYVINNASSTVYSLGPDSQDATGDEIKVDFRPRMAVTKILWYDTNQDGVVSPGVDALHFYCTRQIKAAGSNTGLTCSAGSDIIGTPFECILASHVASFPVEADFKPGSDTFTIDEATNELIDCSEVDVTEHAKGDVLKITAP